MASRIHRGKTQGAAFVLAGLSLVSIVSAPAHAQVLTFFDFNDGNFVSDRGLVSSTLTSNFSSNDISITTPGTTLNADPDGAGPELASAAGSALVVYNTDIGGTVFNGGRFIQFGVNTTGYRDILLDFATVDPNANGGGFNANQFQYSTNGTSFINFGSVYDPPQTTYGIVSYDLSSITNLNNNPNAAFRIVFGGGSTTEITAQNLIDNITVNATSTNPVTAAPEPGTMMMMGIGLGSLAVVRRKKR